MPGILEDFRFPDSMGALSLYQLSRPSPGRDGNENLSRGGELVSELSQRQGIQVPLAGVSVQEVKYCVKQVYCFTGGG